MRDDFASFKLNNFFLAKKLSEKNKNMMKEVFVGSPIYMANEVLDNLKSYYLNHDKHVINYNPYTTDIFSLGIMVLKLLSSFY